ncbi:MAG: D-cysteine desulfhydrase family protein [Armatimonadota bacterium]|jgi:D-cysteine desulfhydrase
MKHYSQPAVPNELPEPICLATLPTRIAHYDALDDVFSGREVWIKRDDETGCLLTGNKVRKLGYLVADALAQGCDTLITTGGIQSNHARATAVFAREMGLHTVLVLRGAAAPVPDGNLFLDALVGADVRTVAGDTGPDVEATMRDVAEQLAAAGRRPYVIPSGGSNEVGLWGYVDALEEIARQTADMQLPIDCIVTAVGSGGTYAGLLLGAKLHDIGAHIVGVNVCDTAEHFRPIILDLCRRAIRRYGLDAHVGDEDIRIINGYVGGGYGEVWPEQVALIRLVAERTGMILDPVYSGKAFFGLADQLSQGRLADYECTLFIHTGGIFGALARRQDLLATDSTR